MYDWELQNYLQQHNYTLTHYEYDDVCKGCPQLNHVKYNPYDDCFEAWSDEGNYFRFKVYYAGESW